MKPLSKKDELKLFNAFKQAFEKFFKTAKQEDINEMFGSRDIDKELK